MASPEPEPEPEKKETKKEKTEIEMFGTQTEKGKIIKVYRNGFFHSMSWVVLK